MHRDWRLAARATTLRAPRSAARSSGCAQQAEVTAEAGPARLAPSALLRLPEEANHRGHALGGRHEQLRREGDPQGALGVKRSEKDWLGCQRKVPVAGREP